MNLPGDFGDERTVSSLPADAERWISNNLILFLVLAGGTLALLMLVFLGFSILSRGALVEAVVALHDGEERGFSATWRAGLTYFWRVLGFVLLLFLVSLGILLAVSVPAGLLAWAILVTAESVWLRVLFVFLVGLLMFVIFILLFVPLYIIWQLALRELVVGGEDIAGALRGGYGRFRRNLGKSLLTWVIQVVLAIGIGIVVAIVGTIYGLLLYGMVAAVATLNSSIATVVTTVVAIVLFFSVAAAVSGIVGAFFSGYWTLAYLRLRRENDSFLSAESG